MRILSLSLPGAILSTVALPWAGCSGGGKDEDSAAEGSCDQIVTAPLGQVSAEEWPAGLSDAIPTYDGVGGRWTATATSDSGVCSGTISLKFTPRSREELLVVQQPWATGLSCGCTVDPHHPSDPALEPVALHEEFSFYVESFGDPALAARTLVGSGALYGPGEELAFRACATDDVDPILGSAYDQVSAVVRIAGGAMSGTLVLTPASGPAETCELSEFVLVEAL